MAVGPERTVVRNIYEADGLQATNQKAAVDKEITFRSTPELVQLSTDLGTRITRNTAEKAILDV